VRGRVVQHRMTIFQLYILNCVLSASQKSRDDSLFLNKCSTEKLCLLADVMLHGLSDTVLLVNCLQQQEH
jgi:hypothetical protein